MSSVTAIAHMYRDDLLCISSATHRLTEQLRQEIVKVFKDNGLRTTSTANIDNFSFLDVKYHGLKKRNCQALCIKTGDKPTYVHSKSNHLPSMIKNIPHSVNKWMSKMLATEGIFDAAPNQIVYRATVFGPGPTVEK